jgi:hypothetical protein
MSEPIPASEYRAKHGATERQIQKAVCQYLDAHGVPYYAVPNGQYRPGQRPEAGMQSGVPDLCIPVRTEAHGALYIELKRPKRYTRPEQRQWLDCLTDAGNACTVCRSVDEVAHVVREYLDGVIMRDDLWPTQR